MKRSLIFLPVIVLAVLLAAYSAYWYYLAGIIEDAAIALRENRAEGAPEIDFSALEIGGFPFRIELTANDGRMESADIALSAARIEANLLPYDLGHIILRVTGRVGVNVMRRDEYGRDMPLRLDGAAKSFLASYIVDGEGPARLDIAVTGFAGDMTDGAEAPVSLNAGVAEIHLRRAPDGASATDLAARLENAALGPGIEPLLGQTIAHAYVEARFQGLALPAMQSADYVRAWAEAGGRADISSAGLDWGGVDIRAEGALTIDRARRLVGTLQTSIAGYRLLTEKLVAAGRMSANDRALLDSTLAIVSALGGGRANLPVGFDQGRIFLGPVAVGELRPLF